MKVNFPVARLTLSLCIFLVVSCGLSNQEASRVYGNPLSTVVAQTVEAGILEVESDWNMRATQFAAAIPVGNTINLVDSYCLARWIDYPTGVSPCDAQSGSNIIKIRKNWVMEDGKTYDNVLWILPGIIKGSVIEAHYPPVRIREGDYFHARVGCSQDGRGCDIGFTVAYQASAGSVVTRLGSWREIYDGQISEVKIDLTDLAGLTVAFVLLTEVVNNEGSIEANWINPCILH